MAKRLTLNTVADAASQDEVKLRIGLIGQIFRIEMRFRLLAALAAVLLTGQASAYDPTKAPRYTSPDMYRPNVDSVVGQDNSSKEDLSGTRAAPDGGIPQRFSKRILEEPKPVDFGADTSGVADAASAVATTASKTGDLGTVRLTPGSYKLDGFAQGAARTWILDANAILTGAYPTLPGQVVRLGYRTVRGTAQSMFGALTDFYDPKFYALSGGRVSSATAALLGVSSYGNTGIGGVSRTSDVGGTGSSMATIGAFGGVINDWTGTTKRSAYAFYGDATRLAGAGTTQFIEGDVINFSDTVAISPSTMFGIGATLGHWMACGGQAPNAKPCSAAYAVVNNGTTWDKGLVFGQDALTRKSGQAEAITLGYGHFIQWYTARGATAAAIQNTMTGTAGTTRLLFADDGFHVTRADGTSLLQVYTDQTNSVVRYDAPIMEPGNLRTPASATDPCQTGQKAFDTNYEYRCVATNRWRRIAYTSDWP